MKKLLILTAMGTLMASAALAETWTGMISDSMCGAKHAAATEKDAKCAQSCVKRGSEAVLVSDGKVLKISADSKDKVADLVGKKVTVTGSLNDGVVTVTDAKAAD